MKLFLVVQSAEEKVGYDCNAGFLIRAKDEAQAREIASQSASDEGPNIWLNPSRVTVTQVTGRGPAGILLTDFRAG